MKTLFTFTLLSLIAVTTLNASAQNRSSTRRGHSTRNQTPMNRIVIGAVDRYYQSNYLANRVRRLEQVVNQMQNHILNLEHVIYSSNNGGYGQSSYFCEVVADYSEKIYTGKARSQREASAKAYSSCTRGERHQYSCSRNKVKCDNIGYTGY